MQNRNLSIQENYNLSFSKERTISTIDNAVKQSLKSKIYVVNAHIFCEGIIDPAYQELIKQGTINTCDGINVKRLVKWTSGKDIDLFPGPDMFKEIIQENRLGPLKHFFLGGSEDVSKGLKEALGEKDKEYYSPPFVKDAEEFNYEFIVSLINAQQPDIIWVGLGAPKQEKVIHKLFDELDKGVLIGVGAAFNFFSGIDSFKRAPATYRRLHLEWLFRLFQEPKRIASRQLRNLKYLIIGYIKYRK
jgi:N-acetylglucosaminyldiphosphoundecaprenol N-acetyl-beta-D-mannosaminyltransferase